MNISQAAPSSKAGISVAARTLARRGLMFYFAILVPLSVLFEALTISTGNSAWILPLMWAPTFASVIARLALREGFKDVSFRFGGTRGLKAVLFALVFPTLIGLVAYGAAWVTGLAHFDPPNSGLVGSLLVDNTLPPAVFFAVALLLASTIGTVLSAFTAAGEEIGWRGYMLTRLIDAGVPRPILASGLIWSFWHLPLILVGMYAAGNMPIISAAIFVVGVTSVSYIFAYLRLSTGSIWSAIVLHAAWNVVIQGVFDLSTVGPSALLWTGESGILVALTLVVAAFVCWQSRLLVSDPTDVMKRRGIEV